MNLRKTPPWLVVLGLAAVVVAVVLIVIYRPLGNSAPRLRVDGNRLVDSTGRTVRLMGVNRSGAEFVCATSNGIWQGPVDNGSVKPMKDWNVRAVRIPLNEDCWLGINGINPQYSGTAYREAVERYVGVLKSNGIIPILDLHWSDGLWTGAGTTCVVPEAKCQKPMPDAANAPAFWESVARSFANDMSVVFDLYNEPFPNQIPGLSVDQSWVCWRDGGSACPGLVYEAAGMQRLLDAVRGTGARNVVFATGNRFGNDLTQWYSHRLNDPTGNLAASWHVYDPSTCRDEACFDREVAPLATRVPVATLEFGQFDCNVEFTEGVMNWLDARKVGYLAWTWNTWDCNQAGLITNYDGTPSTYGTGVRRHLRDQ